MTKETLMVPGGTAQRELAIFYVIALSFTALLCWLLWHLPENFEVGDFAAIRQAVNNVGVYIVAVPALIALLVTVTFHGRLGIKDIGTRLIRLRLSPLYFLIAIIFPPVPQWIGAALFAALTDTPVNYPSAGAALSHFLQVTLFGAVILLGEEIGWRGFMLPRLLSICGWRSAGLIGGGLWSLWHWPLWIPANFAATGSAIATVIVILAGSCGAIAISVVITWLFVRTRYSIALAAILHGANNASMNLVYDMLGDGAGTSPTWPLIYNGTLVIIAAAFLAAPSGTPSRDVTESWHRR